MLKPDPPRSPTTTLYEVVGEVELVPTAQTGVGPSQPPGIPKPQEFERVPNREKISFSGKDPLISGSQEDH